MLQTNLKKIAVIGSSCSGKTTLSIELEKRLGIKRIELDAINWLPDWQELEHDKFREIVTRETEKGAWVVDGNYGSRIGRLVLNRADTIIWLNLPFLTVYRRLFPRIYRRVVKGQELWNGNRENLFNTLFDKDSLLYWIPRRYWTSQRRYRKFFDEPDNANRLLEFSDVQTLDTWLDSIST